MRYEEINCGLQIQKGDIVIGTYPIELQLKTGKLYISNKSSIEIRKHRVLLTPTIDKCYRKVSK